MKRCDEALNASSLQFFASVKRFIASLLPESASIALTLKQPKILTHRSDEAMICIGN
jgi:hypothetical protein